MKVTLQRVICHAKTESGEDEIYCLVTTSGGQLNRIEVGRFEIGIDIRPGILIWHASDNPGVRISFMESDADEPGHGSDDFIGEVTIDTHGNCVPGHRTLDEGFQGNGRFRQFSMTGSGAHYVVQLEVS